MYQINSYLSSVGVDEISCRIRKKICGWENFLSQIQYKATYKKIRKLDVDAFREEGKRFKSRIQLSLAEIFEDQLVAV